VVNSVSLQPPSALAGGFGQTDVFAEEGIFCPFSASEPLELSAVYRPLVQGS
jgi:hypothetical protein